MQTTPSSNTPGAHDSDDFNDAPNQYPDNLTRGANDPNNDSSAAAKTPSGTPQYGDFGHVENQATTSNQPTNHQGGNNPGGTAAPGNVEPEQRGSTPQNLDPSQITETQGADYDDQREGWAKDDPRYGGGTRNWATNEPANKSTGSEPETDDSERTNSNDGSNDNPDEFSALRPDGGRGIPGK